MDVQDSVIPATTIPATPTARDGRQRRRRCDDHPLHRQRRQRGNLAGPPTQPQWQVHVQVRDPVPAIRAQHAHCYEPWDSEETLAA